MHHNLLCTKHLDAFQSLWAEKFRNFHFHLQLVQALDNWTVEAHKAKDRFDPCCDTNGQKSSSDQADDMINLFMTGQLWIPVEVELYSLFFLVSRRSFCHHWRLWIEPQLKRSIDGRARKIFKVHITGFVVIGAHISLHRRILQRYIHLLLT